MITREPAGEESQQAWLARIPKLSPADFRSAWESRAPLRAMLLDFATDEQLAQLRRADLFAMLKLGPEARLAASRVLERVRL